MSSNVCRHTPVLEFLKIAPPKLTQTILANADSKLIEAICEITLNLCKGNLDCNSRERKKLKKYRKNLYKLASAKKNQKRYTKERRILQQHGGAFLPLIIPAALAAIDIYKAFKQ